MAYAICELDNGMIVESEIRPKKDGSLMATVRSRKSGEVSESGYEIYTPSWKFADGEKNKKFKEMVLEEYRKANADKPKAESKDDSDTAPF
jgi:hypothetical protein